MTLDQWVAAVWLAIPVIGFRAALWTATIVDVFNSRRQRMNPR